MPTVHQHPHPHHLCSIGACPPAPTNERLGTHWQRKRQMLVSGQYRAIGTFLLKRNRRINAWWQATGEYAQAGPLSSLRCANKGWCPPGANAARRQT